MVLHLQTLRFGQRPRSRPDYQFPARRRPFDLPAMTFHHLEFVRQTFERSIVDHLPHGVWAAFEHARRIISARFRPGMSNVAVNRVLRILRVATMRTIPRLVYASLGQDSQALRPAAGSPQR